MCKDLRRGGFVEDHAGEYAPVLVGVDEWRGRYPHEVGDLPRQVHAPLLRLFPGDRLAVEAGILEGYFPVDLAHHPLLLEELVDWTTPTWGPTTTSYVVEWTMDLNQAWSFAPVESNSTTVPGLTPGVDYYFRVIARRNDATATYLGFATARPYATP